MYSCFNSVTDIAKILLEHEGIDINLTTDFENENNLEVKCSTSVPLKATKIENALILACEAHFERPAEAEIISMLLQREEIQMSSSNIEAVV